MQLEEGLELGGRTRKHISQQLQRSGSLKFPQATNSVA